MVVAIIGICGGENIVSIVLETSQLLQKSVIVLLALKASCRSFLHLCTVLYDKLC